MARQMQHGAVHQRGGISVRLLVMGMRAAGFVFLHAGEIVTASGVARRGLDFVGKRHARRLRQHGAEIGLRVGMLAPIPAEIVQQKSISGAGDEGEEARIGVVVLHLAEGFGNVRIGLPGEAAAGIFGEAFVQQEFVFIFGGIFHLVAAPGAEDERIANRGFARRCVRRVQRRRQRAPFHLHRGAAEGCAERGFHRRGCGKAETLLNDMPGFVDQFGFAHGRIVRQRP